MKSHGVFSIVDHDHYISDGGHSVVVLELKLWRIYTINCTFIFSVRKSSIYLIVLFHYLAVHMSSFIHIVVLVVKQEQVC